MIDHCWCGRPVGSEGHAERCEKPRVRLEPVVVPVPDTERAFPDALNGLPDNGAADD